MNDFDANDFLTRLFAYLIQQHPVILSIIFLIIVEIFFWIIIKNTKKPKTESWFDYVFKNKIGAIFLSSISCVILMCLIYSIALLFQYPIILPIIFVIFLFFLINYLLVKNIKGKKRKR